MALLSSYTLDSCEGLTYCEPQNKPTICNGKLRTSNFLVFSFGCKIGYLETQPQTIYFFKFYRARFNCKSELLKLNYTALWVMFPNKKQKQTVIIGKFRSYDSINYKKTVLRKQAHWLVKNRVCISRWRHRTSVRCWRNDGASKENTRLQLVFPQHFSFSQISTHVSITR